MKPVAFDIDLGVLRDAALYASREERRPVLRHVLVRWRQPEREFVVIGTDGVLLYRRAVPGSLRRKDFEVLIPAATILWLPKPKRDEPSPVTVTVEEDTVLLSIGECTIRTEAYPGARRFTDIEAVVIPKVFGITLDAPMAFNPKFLAKVSRLSEKPTKVVLVHASGPEAPFLYRAGDALIVQMPIRIADGAA